MSDSNLLRRREFVKTAGSAAVASLVLPGALRADTRRRRYAMVGTGHRGTGRWGADLAKRYADVLEFVGLCDTNPRRLAAGRELIFRDAPAPAHMRLPDSRAGAMSCLTGIAARKSVEQRRPVRIADLVRL